MRMQDADQATEEGRVRKRERTVSIVTQSCVSLGWARRREKGGGRDRDRELCRGLIAALQPNLCRPCESLTAFSVHEHEETLQKVVHCEPLSEARLYQASKPVR